MVAKVPDWGRLGSKFFFDRKGLVVSHLTMEGLIGMLPGWGIFDSKLPK